MPMSSDSFSRSHQARWLAQTRIGIPDSFTDFTAGRGHGTSFAADQCPLHFEHLTSPSTTLSMVPMQVGHMGHCTSHLDWLVT